MQLLKYKLEIRYFPTQSCWAMSCVELHILFIMCPLTQIYIHLYFQVEGADTFAEINDAAVDIIDTFQMVDDPENDYERRILNVSR